MKSQVTRRSSCRLCGASELRLVIPMTATPVADAYVTREQLGEEQPCFPLDLYQCGDCRHVQLLDVVDPETLFGCYSYFSGRSPAMLQHFREYADSVLRRMRPAPGSLVIDVGSNDGAFLRFFQEAGMRVLGIDPARNIAQAANESGIETLPEFLSTALAESLRRQRGPAQVVAANNVFAHTDDMAGMADAIRLLLADDGLFVFEVSYLLDVVERGLLGTIFHEHLCYHSVQPLDRFLRSRGMELIDVERVPVQGGSIIGTAQRLGGPRPVQPRVAEIMALEADRRLHDAATFEEFSARVDGARSDLGRLLKSIEAEGAVCAGFGAGRHSTLLIYHFGLGPVLKFLVDDSPDKQNTFSPGWHIPVLPTNALSEQRPGYVVILAWMHARQIVEKHEAYLAQGGKFITCFPQVQVVASAAEAP
jgi:SAM-dependent methyltransferase